MHTLLEFQRSFARALLTNELDAVADCVIQPERLSIHLNTMLGALAGALRLSYPAVDALVGDAFFDRAAADFAIAHPPAAALLTRYGAGFARFLADYAPAADLPYLADVARLEWAVETASFAPTAQEASPLVEVDLPDAHLALVPSLALLHTEFPAEPIWRAVLEQDDAALARIDPGRAPATLAIWRDGHGAAVTSLGVASAAFLAAVLTGNDAEAALAAAASADPDPIRALTREILSAGFVRLTPLTQGEEE